MERKEQILNKYQNMSAKAGKKLSMDTPATAYAPTRDAKGIGQILEKYAGAPSKEGRPSKLSTGFEGGIGGSFSKKEKFSGSTMPPIEDRDEKGIGQILKKYGGAPSREGQILSQTGAGGPHTGRGTDSTDSGSVSPEGLSSPRGEGFSRRKDVGTSYSFTKDDPISSTATDLGQDQEGLIDDWDEIIEGLNGSYKPLVYQKIGVEGLGRAYQKNPTPVRALAYQQALRKYEKEAEDHKGYVDRYQAYTTQEAFQRRIDAWEAQLTELEEQEEAAKRALGIETASFSGTAPYGAMEQQTQGAGLAESKKAYQDIVDQRETLQRKLAQEKRDKEYLGYEALRGAEDFETESAYRTTANGRPQIFDRTEEVLIESGFDDIRYDAINGNDAARSMLRDVGFVPYEDITPDQVKLFNYVYATKGPKEAYNYMDLIAKKQFTAMDAAGMGFIMGSGAAYPSFALGAAASKAMAKLTGNDDIALDANDMYERFKKDAGQSAGQHPIASTVGSVGGTLALMYGVEKAAGMVAGKAVPAISGLAGGIGKKAAGITALTTAMGGAAIPAASPVISGATIDIVKNALTFATTDAIQNAGELATGNMSVGSYARSAVGNAAGGAVGAAVTGKVSQILANHFVDKQIQTVANLWVQNTLSSFTGAAANMGVRYVIAEDKPTTDQLAAQLASAFAFSFIGGGISALQTSKAYREYFENEVGRIAEAYKNIGGNMQGSGISEAELQHLLEATQTLRQNLRSTYLPGQQELVEQLDGALGVIEEGISSKANSVVSGAAAYTVPAQWQGMGGSASTVPTAQTVPPDVAGFAVPTMGAPEIYGGGAAGSVDELSGLALPEALPLQMDGEDSRMKAEGTATGTKGRTKKRPRLSKREWRQVQNAQIQKYGGMDETEIPESGYVFAHNKFYVIRNYGPGDFEAIARFDPETDKEDINIWLGELRSEEKGRISKAAGTTDEKGRIIPRRWNSSPAGPQDGGKHAGVFPVVPEPEKGPDASGMFQEGSGDLDDLGTRSGGRERLRLPSRFTSDRDFLTKLRMSDELAQAYPEIDPETIDALIELAWQRLKGERDSLATDGLSGFPLPEAGDIRHKMPLDGSFLQRGGKGKSTRKYWRPKLKPAEWELLDYKMATAGEQLNEATCWVYAKEKDVAVFAVYGIGDGTENTPLYAVGGKEAIWAGEAMQRYVEGFNHETDGDGTVLDRWIEAVRSKQRYGSSYFPDAENRGKHAGDVRLFGRSHGRHRAGTTGQSPGDQGEIGRGEAGGTGRRELTGRGPETEGRRSSFASEMDTLMKFRLSDELALTYPEIDPETMDALVGLAWQRLKGERGSLDADGTYDEPDKMMLGGLEDGGKEARLDGGRKEGDSRDGGEVLWSTTGTRRSGSRRTPEQGSAFVARGEREGKTILQNGKWRYAYRITPEGSYAPETKQAVEAAKDWGLLPVVIDSFEKNDGKATYSEAAAVTGPEGQVLLVNGCDSEGIAHEGVHSGLRRNIPGAKEFLATVAEHVDITSEKVQCAVRGIVENYYNKTEKEFKFENLVEETTAFISGLIETGQVEEFFGLTEENSPEVFAAWRALKAAMGANPMTPAKTGLEGPGELSFLQKGTLGPTGDDFISDETAQQLLGDWASVRFLTRKGGLKLKKGMTQSEKIAAIKAAVANIIYKGKPDSNIAGQGEEFRALSTIYGENNKPAAKRKDKVRSNKEQAKYLEQHTRDYKNPIIERYKQKAGLEVVIASDEAWDEMFGEEDEEKKKERAKCLGGKIYFSYSCSKWSDQKMHLALEHEGTHAMWELDFQPYLEFLADVGDYINFASGHTGKLFQKIQKHTGVTMEEFINVLEKRKRVYDEFCAAISGHIAANQYEGVVDGEVVKLSEYFRSEQEFYAFLDRLKGIKETFYIREKKA